jgi:hypothetical protein
MIYSISCAIISVLLWWLYMYNKLPAEKFFRVILRLLPIFLLINFHTPLACYFLIGCFIADVTMSKKQELGSLMYLFVYSITAFKFCSFSFENCIFAYGIMTAIIVSILACWNTNAITKIFCLIYAYTALAFCVIAFQSTFNFGFLCLVIGDVLLTVKELMKDKRLVYTISNSFFFIGMCLVALVL